MSGPVEYGRSRRLRRRGQVPQPLETVFRLRLRLLERIDDFLGQVHPIGEFQERLEFRDLESLDRPTEFGFDEVPEGRSLEVVDEFLALAACSGVAYRDLPRRASLLDSLILVWKNWAV